ncbi:MAG: GNAT family N-acetyltransferase [Fibrobacterota bacterium]
MRLRKAEIGDWEILLHWRNDRQTRKNSHTTHLIHKQDHKKWLKSVLEDGNRKLYICLEEGIPAGTIRADWDTTTHSYELSWTTAPDFRGRGIGKKMVQCLAEKLNARLRAEIHVENTGSAKIAESAGLKCIKKEKGILYYANY